MPFQRGVSNAPSSTVTELVRMNIELQKVTVELIEKMNNLTLRMDRMFSLFEDAARNINVEDTGALKTQLQELLEQNKTIARGLLAVEQYLKEKQPQNLANFQQKPAQYL